VVVCESTKAGYDLTDSRGSDGSLASAPIRRVRVITAFRPSAEFSDLSMIVCSMLAPLLGG
jgi:hypothetical protein